MDFSKNMQSQIIETQYGLEMQRKVLFNPTIHTLGVSIHHLLCITIQWYITWYSIVDFCRWTEPFPKPSCFLAVSRSKHGYIMHDIWYILIFDISIQLNLYWYCINGLMYHDMAIYQYIRLYFTWFSRLINLLLP